MILTPAALAASAIVSTSPRRTSAARPSSRISDKLRASGPAPQTARALPSHNLPLARKAAEVVVRGACSLGGDHAGTDRSLRSTRGAEHLALPRLDHTLEHLAALARLGVCDPDPGHAEPVLGIEVSI